ncbi:zinc-ribbon domain-containing protein [Thauera humireducens]|uniref:zinc-ribbon domain-containing protein n=1 Tax=Thauera humireducens TaxID=1134435 RepID=UPI00311D5259
MMLTRCPACQTVFRLSPEQLNARRGEVRCGHCFHPFNAREHEIRPREALATPRAPHLTFPEIEKPEPPRPPAEPPHPAPEHSPTQAASLTDLDFEIPDFPGLTPPDEHSAPQAHGTKPQSSGQHTAAALPDVLRSGRRPASTEPAAPNRHQPLRPNRSSKKRGRANSMLKNRGQAHARPRRSATPPFQSPSRSHRSTSSRPTSTSHASTHATAVRRSRPARQYARWKGSPSACYSDCCWRRAPTCIAPTSPANCRACARS